MNEMGTAPTPSPLVLALPVSLPADPVALFRSVVRSEAFPFLSFRCGTETETETGKHSSTAQGRKRKRNRQRLKAGRNSGTLAATGTKPERTSGTRERNGTKQATLGRNRKPEGSPKRKGRHTTFPSLPYFRYSHFPFLSRHVCATIKTFFPLLRYL